MGVSIYPRFGFFFKAFVIAGIIYLGKVYRLYITKIKIHKVGALLSFLILIVATVFKYDVNVGGMKFGNPLFFLIVSCAGFYLTLSIADLIARKPNFISNALSIIGENTLTIMALHYLAFKLVSLLQIAIYNYPIKFLAYYPVIPYKTAYWWIPYTLVGIFVPLIVALFSDKLKEFVINNYRQLKKKSENKIRPI